MIRVNDTDWPVLILSVGPDSLDVAASQLPAFSRLCLPEPRVIAATVHGHGHPRGRQPGPAGGLDPSVRAGADDQRPRHRLDDRRRHAPQHRRGAPARCRITSCSAAPRIRSPRRASRCSGSARCWSRSPRRKSSNGTESPGKPRVLGKYVQPGERSASAARKWIQCTHPQSSEALYWRRVMRSTRSVWIAVLAGMIGTAVAVPTSAAERARVLDKESFMEMEGVASPAISPDGEADRLHARVDRQDQGPVPHQPLGRTTSRPAALRELTRGAWRDSAPVWSPDVEAHRVPLGPRRHQSDYTMLGRHRRVAQLTHLPRARRCRPEVVARRQARSRSRRSLPDEDPILKVKLPKRPRGAEWAEGADAGRSPAPGRATAPGRSRRATRTCSSIDALVGGTPRQVTERQVQSRGAGMVGRRQDDLCLRHPQARCRIPARRHARSTRVDVKTLARSRR